MFEFEDDIYWKLSPFFRDIWSEMTPEKKRTFIKNYIQKKK